MMAPVVERRAPSARLRAIVRSFGERRLLLGGRVATVPLPARPDQFIEFYLCDRYAVSLDGGAEQPAPAMALVGPQSYRRARLMLSGELHVFSIHFQPGGFHVLFGVAMQALVDEGVPAADVMGVAAHDLRDRVLLAQGFDGRIAAFEAWLVARDAHLLPIDPVARAAAALRDAGGQFGIGSLARAAGLSERQFTRRFTMQVGLPPKRFARTVRLNRVLDAKARRPGARWTELVHQAGYADQAHFVRDCRELAGDTPRGFFDQWHEYR